MEKIISIRKCRKDDFLWVLWLLKQLWPKHKFILKDIESVFYNAIKSSNQQYFCAINNKKIIWFWSFNIKNWLYAMWKVAILDELIVNGKHRQMWIAKKLLDYMIIFAKKNNCICIELECWYDRREAHMFYEKYWFEKWDGCFFSISLD